MSVIAWDGKLLAADKRSANGNIIRTVTKIFRYDGVLTGCVGCYDEGLEMIRWIQEGQDPKKFPGSQRDHDKFSPVIMIESSTIYVFETCPTPLVIEDPFFAIGSGAMAAMAAMQCGKSAVEAVRIASLFDMSCGNGVDVLKV